MRSIWTALAVVSCALASACFGAVEPADLFQDVELMTPNPAGAAGTGSSKPIGAKALVGWLEGVGAPLNATVERAAFSAGRTQLILHDVTCSSALNRAYEAKKAMERPGSFDYACKEGVLTLTGAAPEAKEGETPMRLPVWNPWGADDWHVGPFTALPAVKTGESFKPAVLEFEGSRATARLTPKAPNRFVDVMGAGLGDAKWAARPVPGGTVYSKAGWSVQVEQDGAVVTVLLTGP